MSKIQTLSSDIINIQEPDWKETHPSLEEYVRSQIPRPYQNHKNDLIRWAFKLGMRYARHKAADLVNDALAESVKEAGKRSPSVYQNRYE